MHVNKATNYKDGYQYKCLSCKKQKSIKQHPYNKCYMPSNMPMAIVARIFFIYFPDGVNATDLRRKLIANHQ